MKSFIRIEDLYEGPPQSANGGYVCGLLGTHYQGAVQVTLKRPTPVSQDLIIEDQGLGVRVLRDEETVYAVAEPSEVSLSVPVPPSFEEAEEATHRFVGHHDHIFPNCFVCGTHREKVTGMRIFAGPVGSGGLHASDWTPHVTLADASGWIKPEFLWAALDCPGFFATTAGEQGASALLGRLTADITGSVKAGERCVVTAWSMGGEGRKRLAGSAVFNAKSALVALAKATWITIDATEKKKMTESVI